VKRIDHSLLGKSLASGGLRSTRQRRRVFEVLMEKRDHPTAEEVYHRAKRKMPEISFATVYNCLDMMVKHDLVKQVNMDRAPTRYCPNMKEHCHFHCEKCDSVIDIDFNKYPQGIQMPEGFQVKGYQITLQGTCPNCAKASR
jgi:Fur family transcriptional regulator, peroxide stress response regulator